MAKSKAFFGIRKRSTKSLTFSRDAYGQQITKDRVSEVKNPRTTAQMQQRMYLTTIGSAYRALKVICDHSFQGISYGAKTMSKFNSENLKAIKLDPTKFNMNDFGTNKLMPGAYIIADGELDRPNITNVVAIARSTTALTVTLTGVNGASFDYSKLFAKDGDMITICFIAPKNDNKLFFGYLRLKAIDITKHTLAEAVALESNLDINAVVATDDETITLGTGYIETLTSADDAKVGWDVIASAKANGSWLRSPAQIEWSDIPASFVNAAATALATYPQGANYVLNGGV